jgi:pimeloyl-ACP methyl ester carboxylesterase
VTHETRFAKAADGVYLAYQVVGAGPVDVVIDLHAFAGNVDPIWDEPDWGRFLAEVTEFARLIVHDRRGSGASTRDAPPPNLETRAADLLTVLDEIGSEAPVLGAGASTGAMHALFAATYPDRTSGLVWNYPRPRLAWAPDYPWGQRGDAFEAALAEARKWGTTEQAREQAQNRAAQRLGVPHEQRHTLTIDEDVVRRYARITRNTVSPDVAEALTRILWQTDVRDILPSVHTPTALIVGDADVQAEREEAEYVASLMPNATVHLLKGRAGLQTEAQMAIVRELAGLERRPAVSTVLATVLFTDIVDSTRKQQSLATVAGGNSYSPIILRFAVLSRTGAEPSTTPPATGSSRASWGPPAPSTAHTRSPRGSPALDSRHEPASTSANARSSMASPVVSRSRSLRGSSAPPGRERSWSPGP